MSNINVDLRRLAIDEHAHRLKQAMDQAGSVDTLNITMDQINGQSSNELIELLSENGYAVQPRDGQEQTYNISAHRFH